MAAMTTQVDQHTTVRELVGRYPQTRGVFEKFKLDYCCGGDKSLADAAAERELELAALQGALEKALNASPAGNEVAETNWYDAPLSELVAHIVETHHAYVKTALPRLRLLIPRVVDAHADRHSESLCQVRDHFDLLDNEISAHLMKEEKVLFPFILALEQHKREGTLEPHAPFGSIQNPIQQMEHEHETAGRELAILRQVTNGYALPDDACSSFEALYDELKSFEADLREHIHLENNILFPRAVEMQQAT
jgi:regulator of cell morphogenesis and NO signaling